MTLWIHLRAAAGHWQPLAWLQGFFAHSSPERAPAEHVGMYAGSLLPRDTWDHS